MPKKFKITEDQFQRLVKKNVKETEEFDFEDENDFEDESEFEIQDFGFDYEGEDEPEMGLPRGQRPIKIQYGRGEWKKGDEIPYSPIKPSDVPLDRLYLKKKK